MKTKPFNLQAALAGKPWGAKNGKKGLWIAYDPGAPSVDKVVARLEEIPWRVFRHVDGRDRPNEDSDWDLVMFSEKKTVYVNLYRSGKSEWFYDQFLASEQARILGAIYAVIPVEIEE